MARDTQPGAEGLLDAGDYDALSAYVDTLPAKKGAPAKASPRGASAADALGAYLSDIENRPAPPVPPAKPGMLRTIADMGIKGAQGVVDLGQSVVGAASLATGGLAGKSMRAIGYDPAATNQALGEYLSPAQRDAEEKVNKADGFGDTVMTALDNPRAIAGSVAESLPSMFGIGGVTNAVARRIALRAAAPFGGITTEAGAKAAQDALDAAAGKLMLTTGVAEGGQSAGQIADEAQAAGRDYSQYAVPALASGVATAAITRGAGALMGDAKTAIFSGSKAAGVSGSLPARVAKGFISEGALQEMPQSAEEQVMTNLAMGKDPGEGVGNQAAVGLLTGGAMGMGEGAISPHHAADHVRATEMVPEVGVLSAAANAGTEAKASAMKNAPPVQPQPAQPAPVDPVLEQIKTLPDGARDEALHAYNIINRPDVPKGVRQYNSKLLDKHLATLEMANVPNPLAPSTTPLLEDSSQTLYADSSGQVSKDRAALAQAQEAPVVASPATESIATLPPAAAPAEVQVPVESTETGKPAPTSEAQAAAREGPFATAEDARAYIAQQRRAGGSRIEALPLPHDDGSFGTAIKGAPEYPRAEAFKAQQDLRAIGVQDGDILTKAGSVFKSKLAANNALKKAGATHAVAAVTGGFVVRPNDVQAFPEHTGTLGIARADMPQIKSEHHGPLVNFLNARGVAHETEELDPSTLKPTQAEYTRSKVDQSAKITDSDRSILVSSDNYVLDGHHQWLAAGAQGKPVKAIRLNAPIKDLLPLAKEFPSAQTADEQASAASTKHAAPAALPEQDGQPPAGEPAEDGADGAHGTAVEPDAALKTSQLDTPERLAENRKINAELQAAHEKGAGYKVPDDVATALRKFGAEPTATNKETAWELPTRVGRLGDVVITFDPKTNKATIAAQHMGKTMDTREAEGAVAIAAAVERARDGLEAGTMKMAREHFAKTNGMPQEKATALPDASGTKGEPDTAFSRTSPEARALRALSGADPLFSLPKSTKNTIAGIAEDNDPGIRVRKLPNAMGREAYELTLPSGESGTITIRPRSENGMPHVYDMKLEEGDAKSISTERPGKNGESVDKDDVWLDASNLKEGGFGSMLYNIAATFAHNTGRIFIGDPHGLSDAALRRRTEHMLSSALKFGTTEHLAPHARQVEGAKDIGVPPLRWTYGDDARNIESLVRTSLESFDNAGGNPITFDPATGRFLDSSGAELDREAIKALVGEGLGRRADAGVDTLRRNAVLRALSGSVEDAAARSGGERGSADGRAAERAAAAGPDAQAGAGRTTAEARSGSDAVPRGEGGAGEQRMGLLERFLGLASEPAAAGIFYRRGQLPLSFDRLSEDEAHAGQQALKAFGLNVQIAPTESDLPQWAKDDLRSRGASGVRGLYSRQRDTTWLVRENIDSPREMLFVALHEAFHRGLHKTFGADVQPLLNTIFMGNQNVRQETARYMRELNIGRNEAIEEVLADMAGAGTAKELKGWGKLVAFLKGVLLKLAKKFDVKMDFSDDMVEDLVAGLRRAGMNDVHVEGGTTHAGDVAFSRGIELPQRARDTFNDWMDTSKTFSWWNKTVGTQYQKAEKDSHFKRAFDATQDYILDVSRLANDAADRARDLLPRLEQLKDVLKDTPLDKNRTTEKDVNAITKAIFQGTLADKREYRPEELKRVFGLNDKQRELYRQFRDSVNKSVDDLTTSTAAKLLRNSGIVQDMIQDELDGGDHKGLVDVANKIVEQDPKFKALADQVKEISDRAETLKKEGYAPLMRFGQYAVSLRDAKTHALQEFHLFESERLANAKARELVGKGDVEKSIMSQQDYKLLKGVSPESLELFGDILEKAGLFDTRDEVFQTYLRQAIDQRSAMKRMIHREGFPGFSQDVRRVLATFVTSNARLSSKNLHFSNMLEAVENIPKAKGDVRDEATKLIKYVQEPVEEAHNIRGLLFAQYIGGNVASALVNTTQTLTMTYPYLSQFTNPAKAATTVLSAMKQAAGTPKGALGEALARAEQEGTVSPQEIHHLNAEAMGKFGSNPAVQKAMFLWGSLFSLAEQYNRRVAFIAAYDTAIGNKIADPYEFAKKAVEETQGVYNKGNRPNWARGAVGSTLFTFKQFSISYLEFLSRLPTREKALALAILMLASGAEGLPFSDDIDDVIDTIAERMGYNFNSKAAKRKFVGDALGEGASQFLLKGASSIPGMPIDIAARMGMSNLIPGTGMLRLDSKDHMKDVLEFAGPLGSLVQNGAKAAAGGGWMSMAPTSLQNLAKSADMFQTGMYRDSKGRKVIDTDAVDAAWKGIGFQPADVARESERERLVQSSIDVAKQKQTAIADAIAQARFENDPEKAQAARDELKQWNEDNPDSRITVTQLQITARLKEMRKTREQRTIKAAPTTMRADVRAQLQ